MVRADRYSFVRSSAELQIETVKNFHEQYATAIRTRYPQIRRRPEWVLLLTVFYILFLLLPFALVIISPWWHPVSLPLPLLTSLLLIMTHVMITSTTDPANGLLAGITFPAMVLVEIYISYNSMVRYEFLSVEWKDRNICLPVMHAIPYLPKLKE